MSDASRQYVVWPAVVVGFTALGLYTATLAPGLLWGGGDFARFQTWAFLGHAEGTADIFTHTLWVLLAHPFTWLPIGDPAWRANFASAVFGTLALMLFYLSSRALRCSNRAGLLATAALGLSHTFWTYAVMPKVYSLNALLLVACFALLLRWRATARDGWLVVFAAMFGLSFLNHLVMGTAAAGFAAFIGVTLWPRRHTARTSQALTLAAFGFALGLTPYVAELMQTGSAGTTANTIGGFVAGLRYAVVHPVALAAGVGWGFALGLYQFPITTIVGAIGLKGLWRRDRAMAAAVILTLAGTTVFLMGALDPRAGSVYVWNLHYYLQAYVAFAFAIAVGFEMLLTTRPRAIVLATLLTTAAPVAVYAAAPIVVGRIVHDVPDFRPIPGRDNLAYVLSPWKQRETGARRVGEGILHALPPRAVLFADYGPWAIVHYLQVVEHARPDVEVVRLGHFASQVPAIMARSDQPDLFLADTYRYYDLHGIGQHFEIVPAGVIYRLVARHVERQ